MESKRIVKSVRIDGDHDAPEAADPANDEDVDGCKSTSTTGSEPTASTAGGSNHVTSGGGAGSAVKMTKSVLFDSRSTAHAHCKKVQSVADCWRCMVRGSNLVKVRPNGRTYNRFFSLDEDLSSIRWVPTSKKASKALVAICNIREVRCVHTSEVMSHVTAGGPSSSMGASASGGGAGGSSGLAGGSSGGSVGGSCSSVDCTFSIIHGEDFASLDLIAPTAEEANIWVTGLNALLGTQSGNALGETEILRERWLRQVFERAAGSEASENGAAGDQGHSSVILDQNAAIALLKEINSDLATGRIRQKMAEFDSMKSAEERGRISSRDFVTMFQEMATRPEIHFLLIRFANKDFFTADDFRHFLECEQGMTEVTADKCIQLIEQYEPSAEARSKHHLILDGMTRFLLSEEGDVFDPEQMHVHQDMTAPLAHYFISSSHNTYLLEDQLRGPSSVEGYVRALQSGCRCVKIDVWDGPDNNGPVVCHGNTLTTKIPFTDVVQVISEYAFEASKYPLLIHLENHCSPRQQKMVARVLREGFGAALYIPATSADDKAVPLALTSPQDLIGKIIIAGKRLDKETSAEAEGDVSDEDEGAETNRRRGQSRKLKLCRELSQLIALNRSSASKWPLVRDKNSEQSQGAFSLNESAAMRLLTSGPNSWAEAAQRCLLRVFPNGSRVDSSNFSPLEFWNSGVQMVALNFQTPGLMMDLYDGKFRQNGGCGYVLKPAMMRQPGFNIPLSPKDVLPSTPPQLLRIRVISGQQLPRPRGSAAKATVVDPYVLIQIYGIPIDCAEKKTRTVLDEGDCPVFEESLEFYIHHPEMALVRFIVLDDEFIGDDFIGQYTIPFQCMRAGYRHIRLLSNLGESLDNATLFVHVAFSEKWAGEQLLQKHRSKPVKKQTTIRMTGLKQVDEHLKATIGTIVEAARARQNVSQALFELRAECGLPVTANIKQCLRVLLLRLATCSDVTKCEMSADNVFPALRIETASNGNLPAALHRTLVAFEKSILECHFLRDKSAAILNELDERVATLNRFYEQLDELVMQACFKGKQISRVYDVYGWDMGLISNQLQLLRKCQEDCGTILEQVRRSDVALSNYYRQTTERPSLQLILSVAPDNGSDPSIPTSPTHSNGSVAAAHMQSGGNISLSRCTTYPTPLQRSADGSQEPKLKSILKKSSSSADISALTDGDGGYYVPKPPKESAEDEEE